jgi:hypothetical protein
MSRKKSTRKCQDVSYYYYGHTSHLTCDIDDHLTIAGQLSQYSLQDMALLVLGKCPMLHLIESQLILHRWSTVARNAHDLHVVHAKRLESVDDCFCDLEHLLKSRRHSSRRERGYGFPCQPAPTCRVQRLQLHAYYDRNYSTMHIAGYTRYSCRFDRISLHDGHCYRCRSRYRYWII